MHEQGQNGQVWTEDSPSSPASPSLLQLDQEIQPFYLGKEAVKQHGVLNRTFSSLNPFKVRLPSCSVTELLLYQEPRSLLLANYPDYQRQRKAACSFPPNLSLYANCRRIKQVEAGSTQRTSQPRR